MRMGGRPMKERNRYGNSPCWNEDLPQGNHRQDEGHAFCDFLRSAASYIR
jgi:hypothetical protein